MDSHYKAFIVVALVTVAVFAMARPIFLSWMSAEDFALRRNCWLAITAAAFLVPNFWLFMALAAVIVVVAGHRDSNPAALYLFLLLVIPPLQADLPTFGVVKTLFPLQNFRLLSIVLLVPVALRLYRENSLPAHRGGLSAGPRMVAADVFLFLFILLQLVLFTPYESGTNSIRRAFLIVLDVWLPYYVVSRACRNRRMIVEAMSALALAALILAPLAIIETLRAWLLYGGLGDDWNIPNTLYLRRNDLLRASVTAGHSIVLGYFFAVALGLWLYLQRQVPRGWAALGIAGLAIGVAATFSRGPWLGAVIAVLGYLALGPGALQRSIKGLSLFAVIGAITLATPLGGRIVGALPFVGHIGSDTVTYREQLLRVSLQLIQQNPLFGSPLFLAQMEELRTGEGIIDLVNAYATFALSFGLVGLGLFVAFMGVIVVRTWRTVWALSGVDPDSALIGASLLACLASVLIMLATVSNYLSIPYVYLALAALAAAYCHQAEHALLGDPAEPLVEHRVQAARSGLAARSPPS
ncbi:MAG: O-antigen ligase family protein [Caldimonas sp.]